MGKLSPKILNTHVLLFSENTFVRNSLGSRLNELENLDLIICEGWEDVLEQFRTNYRFDVLITDSDTGLVKDLVNSAGIEVIGIKKDFNPFVLIKEVKSKLDSRSLS